MRDFDKKYTTQLQDQQLAIEELTQVFNLNKLRVEIETGMLERLKEVRHQIRQESISYI
jgi:uncharacterized protein YggU (UPF0235/DUF167 family)